MEDERFGRYRLVRRIGGGGMADVFLAELEGAEGVTRELVIKKVSHTLSLDREAVEMFVQEARVAARLHHPNVVQVYEFGRAGDGYFLAMELVEGCDLASLLKDHVGQSLPLGVVAWVFQELLEALGYVHGLADGRAKALGLVHRDVSPHNVLLGRAGQVKLADFGIATATARVHDGGVKGKFAYMAPEQARGERLDARADLYAVGAMLYEALAGRRAQPTRATEVMLDAARRGDVAPVEEVAPWVHPALAAVVGRCLARDPDDRFPDAATFREALGEALFVAGASPDRAALQAMVRARAEGAEAPRAERTLTSHDDSDTNHPKSSSNEDSGEGERPRSLEPEPSPPSRSRRLFERAMIAVGVFTLAVLAERRTRPVVAPAAVTVALPDEVAVRGWFEGAGRAAAAARCRCRVEARYYRRAAEVEGWLRRGEVALAAVTTVALPQMLPWVLRGANDPRGDARAAVTRALGAWPGGAALAPVAVDPVVMAVRDDVPGQGGPRLAARRLGLVVAVDAQVGHGLPPAFAWSEDPTSWTWWDVLAAAWLFRPPGAVGGVALGLSGEAGLGAWFAVAGPWGGDRTGTNDLRGVEETAAWSALLASLGLLAPGPVEPRRDVVYVGSLRALSATEGWSLAPLPADVGMPGAAPRRPTSPGVYGEVLGWVARTGAPAGSPALAAWQVLRAPSAARGLARAWGAVPAHRDGGRGEGELQGLLGQGERLIDRGFTLTVCPRPGDAGRVAGAFEGVMRQAVSGSPRPFVGEGRWWWPTVRAVVAGAFERDEVDGGL